jgi:hypothetical protein
MGEENYNIVKLIWLKTILQIPLDPTALLYVMQIGRISVMMHIERSTFNGTGHIIKDRNDGFCLA